MAEKEYIERKKAYETITDLAGSATTKAAYAAIWKCARALKNIPASDVKNVEYAHAVKFYSNPYTDRFFTTCTRCDGKINIKDNYCKHCGAKII